MTTRRLTQQDFLKRAFDRHGNKYSYTKSEYTTSANLVIVTCPDHGDFTIKASSLMRGIGCAKCSAHKGGVRNTKETFEEKSRLCHGEIYDYSDVVYINNKVKVDITCPTHGRFQQRPDMHIQGQGCGECWNEVRGWISAPVVERSRNSGRDAYLYIAESEDNGQVFYKFGICYSSNLHNRLYVLNKYYPFILIHLLEDTIEECIEFEKEVKEQVQRYKPTKHFHGHTECFTVGETT